MTCGRCSLCCFSVFALSLPKCLTPVCCKKGDECRKTQCRWYLGNEACSVSGGEYVQRCTGSPIEDTSNCTRCRYHPGDDARKCAADQYIIQTCRPRGQEYRDVSKCASCR